MHTRKNNESAADIRYYKKKKNKTKSKLYVHYIHCVSKFGQKKLYQLILR